MSDGKYPPLTDSLDDLPRTLRREREARERAQRDGQSGYGAPDATSGYGPASGYAAQPGYAADTFPATVVKFDVPFFSLVAFFLKAVLAAIPALIVLLGLLYGLGIVLKTYLPWIVQTEILIRFPR